MKCAVCGASFTQYRPTQTFCSGACRVKAHRAKRAGKPVTPAVTPDVEVSAPEPAQQPSVTPDVTALSDSDLTDEIGRRVNAEVNGLLEIAARLEAGESINYETMTKTEVAILKRFRRDHQKFTDAVWSVFSVSAKRWAEEAHVKQAKYLGGWQKQLREEEEKLKQQRRDLTGETLSSHVWGLTELDVKRLRSFLHPDKHLLCGNAKRANDLSISLEALVDSADRAVKAKAQQDEAKKRRSESAKKAAEKRKAKAG